MILINFKPWVSEIGTSSFAFPVTKTSRLKSLEFEAIFFRNIIVGVREFFQRMHWMVLVALNTVLWNFSILIWWLFLNHRFWINSVKDFFFREVAWSSILSKLSLFILDFHLRIFIRHSKSPELEQSRSLVTSNNSWQHFLF